MMRYGSIDQTWPHSTAPSQKKSRTEYRTQFRHFYSRLYFCPPQAPPKTLLQPFVGLLLLFGNVFRKKTLIIIFHKKNTISSKNSVFFAIFQIHTTSRVGGGCLVFQENSVFLPLWETQRQKITFYCVFRSNLGFPPGPVKGCLSVV